MCYLNMSLLKTMMTVKDSKHNKSHHTYMPHGYCKMFIPVNVIVHSRCLYQDPKNSRLQKVPNGRSQYMTDTLFLSR